MFGRIMPLDLGCDAPGFGWIKPFVQTSGMMDVQVVHHENDPISIRIDHIDQVTQDLSAVKLCPS